MTAGVGGGPALSWTWGRFESLSGDDVYDLLALRSRTFVVEQACIFLDADEADRQAWHLLGRGPGADAVEARAPLLAYLRCLDPGTKYEGPSIGRVVVAGEQRGLGLGRVVMIEGIARVRTIWPAAVVVINAQARLEAFYASLGFVREGSPYDEDGIEHVEMRLAPTTGENDR